MKNRLPPTATLAPPLALPDDVDPPAADFLSTSQKKALDELTAMVELGACKATYGGFRIRTAPLMFGQSGAGKTAIIRRLAERLGDENSPQPLLNLSCPGWVITAAKAEPSSLSLVKAFVSKHHARGGLIHMDEIEKSVPTGTSAWSETWCVTVIGEMLALIDTLTLGGADNRLLSAGWTQEDIARLAGGGFTLIGSGTWQRAAEKAENDGATHREVMEEEMILPPELTRRFSPRYIEIAIPDKRDFVLALTGLYRDLGLPTRESMIDVVSDAAVGSGLGFRFIECHLTDLLLRYPELRRPAAKQNISTSRKVISLAAYEEMKRSVHGLFDGLEPVVAALRLQVRLHEAHFFDQNPGPLDEKTMTAMDFDQTCLDLLAGLQLRYAVSEKTRHELHATFWRSGHAVAMFVSQHLDQDLTWLASKNLMNLFGSCQLRVSKVIAAWTFLCSFDTPEAG